MILTALIILAALGVVFGAGLAVASRYFTVETDPREQEVAAALPGANCGACGHPGCAGYAAAVVKGAAVDLCVPGGPKVAAALAKIMGQTLDTTRTPLRAVVHCQGGRDAAPQRYIYDGLQDCRAAQLVQGGPKKCAYGCLGFGTCAAACPFGAIKMSREGLPVIDRDRCTGCGKCVKACPRGIIKLLPLDAAAALACNNPDPAKLVRGVCEYVCIKCRKCVKLSEATGAVTMEGPLPVIHYDKAADLAAVMAGCPKRCFVKLETRGFTRVEKPQPALAGAAEKTA
ncbi:MAG TPA: RnfABCDGE type electron transport complex subunit B [Candidatus Brocadiia bacterium]|nr:RnfABCDGE type electron transport complex subunit B [Candidatus Brocadiia bacterium]